MRPRSRWSHPINPLIATATLSSAARSQGRKSQCNSSRSPFSKLADGAATDPPAGPGVGREGGGTHQVSRRRAAAGECTAQGGFCGDNSSSSSSDGRALCPCVA
jgi:hypothetical protein